MKLVSFFILDCDLAFSACSPPFSSFTLPIFLHSLHTHLWTEHILLNLPSWLSVWSTPHHLAFFAYHFRAGVSTFVRGPHKLLNKRSRAGHLT